LKWKRCLLCGVCYIMKPVKNPQFKVEYTTKGCRVCWHRWYRNQLKKNCFNAITQQYKLNRGKIKEAKFLETFVNMTKREDPIMMAEVWEEATQEFLEKVTSLWVRNLR